MHYGNFNQERSGAATEDLHAWEAAGADSAEALSAWVGARLAAHEAALAALLAVEGVRTPENSLRLYDEAIEQLSLAGSQAGILNSVAADKAVRNQAQLEAQRVAQAASALSLNRAVYEALAAIDLGNSSAATKHYVERTLLSYRLAGVDKDQATRDRLQALHDKATQLSLTFSRNIQEGAKTIEAIVAELDGLPADYLARHPADADGRVTLSTDPPDMQPVMTFAANAALRERMFFAYNTRAYPANKTILEQLLTTRQEIAGILGFRSWADLATADQMMASAANARAFLAKLNEASLEGARRDHELILNFTRQRQPELMAIDIASRGYWYEQFRRSAFDFDSQSVRPYFPYAQVEAGVLETAARLFKIEFRRTTAPAWHPEVSVFEVNDRGRIVGRFYLDMHPREGKDKWFSASPVVTGVRGRALPIQRCGHFLSRVRPPDARHPGRTHGVGGHQRICHRGRFHRGALADAGRVFPRREAASCLCETLSDRRNAPFRDHQKNEAGRSLRTRRLGSFAAFLHHALAGPARPEPGGPGPGPHHPAALSEPATLDVAGRQPHVRELWPSDRLLVELLYLCF
jgi:thimet oligopeptidase